ncbi:MAG: hypothetical protein V1832_01985 [Nitrospirota bacterium]
MEYQMEYQLKKNETKNLDNTKDLSNNVYVKYYELFPIEIFVWGRESSSMMYGVFAVIEDAAAFITITLLFCSPECCTSLLNWRFLRFIPNSKTAYLRLMKIKIKTKQKQLIDQFAKR